VNLQNRISGLVALAVLIAIASVLISPAVPSTPTLPPVSALLLVGLIMVCSHAPVPKRRPVVALFGGAEAISLAAWLGFATAARALRC
jgi:4-hydroxybenzoate polyprenyltransferase